MLYLTQGPNQLYAVGFIITHFTYEHTGVQGNKRIFHCHCGLIPVPDRYSLGLCLMVKLYLAPASVLKNAGTHPPAPAMLEALCQTRSQACHISSILFCFSIIANITQ